MNPILAASLGAGAVLLVNGVAAMIGVGKIIGRLDGVIEHVAAIEEAGDARETANQERHKENRKRLKSLRKDVKRINGSVARHEQVIRNITED